MGRILVSSSHFDTLCKDARKLLEDNGHVVVYDKNRSFPAYSYDELKDIIGDIDAAIIGMDVYNEDVFRIAGKLKAVAKFGVGVDNIDLKAATKYGVKALNAPGQNSNSVAELTIGFIVDMLRRVIPIHQELEKGNWPRWIGEEIRGKTIGLIGFGAIARLVAKKLSGFDVKIKAYDPLINQELAAQLGAEPWGLDELIAESDVVSLHIPVVADTYHMFNQDMFSRMKKGAYLVNTARGGLVDLDALTQALREGQLGGAALDAFEVEPLSAGAEIFRYNVICTPHIGAETNESYRDVSLCVARDIVAVLAGKEPVCWANKPRD
jgi:D-3-phosphoglycerate dehydrogenase / 2-oxoglutarate reductase